MKMTGIKIVAATLLFSVLTASCQKNDFTCTCQSTDALGNNSTQTYDLDNQTRADAIENCENFETDNAFVTRTCNL